MQNGYLFYFNNIVDIFKDKNFRGWGRKRTGRFAQWCYKVFGGSITFVEDGFIRSVGLGVDAAKPFSIVEDTIGIYYDATVPSGLENILNTYDFATDKQYKTKAKEAMNLIRKHEVSKYNHAPMVDKEFLKKFKFNKTKPAILIVAQTAEDASLIYGLASTCTTAEMIADACNENMNATIYIKMHPDVLSGKKKSDIIQDEIPAECILLDEDVNPISLLKHFDKVYTKTSGMGMEALILGLDVVCYGMPYYAGWGLTIDKVKCERRTSKLGLEALFYGAYVMYPKYINPYTRELSDIFRTIDTVLIQRKVEIVKELHKAYFFGFSRWKHTFIKSFISELKENNKIFINPLSGKNNLEYALKRGLDRESKIYIWGRKSFIDVETYAKKHKIDIYRVEDGFLRSVGLGSDLTQPYSQVVDSRGIYFDPTQESDLECILNDYTFSTDSQLMIRAQKIQQYIIEKKLSKYNVDHEKILNFPKDKQIILVPGQVEDDASIVYGAKGMTNLSLLKEVREKNLFAYIIYKPHPDVLAGNRVGNIDKNIALEYCNEIVQDVALDSIFMYVHEVHTMTSLVGFEALLRGLDVYTYGIPFYASWGLTNDKYTCKRRTKKLKLEELIAGSLILYPRYLDPETNKLCTVEHFLSTFELEKEKHLKSKFYKIKTKMRNFISRKGQGLLSLLLRS